MDVIYNDQLVSSEEVRLSFDDRSFQYGDGLFETIMCINGNVRFFDFHMDRLTKGLHALSIAVPTFFLRDNFQKRLQDLAIINGYSKSARIKIQVWRKSGGLYIPLRNEANVLISVSQPKERPKIIQRAGIAQKVQLSYSNYSAYKTSNSLPYILAGIEMKERDLNEIMITDIHGNVSECSSSNIFWIEGDQLYTPALSTGCISGIMRRHLMEQAAKEKIPVNEVEKPAEVLYDAKSVFCCNVTGIYTFAAIGEKAFETTLPEYIERWTAF